VVSEIDNPYHKNFYLGQDDIRTTQIDSEGWRIPQPYEATRIYYEGPDGSWTNLSFGDYRKYFGNLYGATTSRPEFELPSVDEGLRSKAEVGALLKLKDQRVNLAQAFAERAQVANMFTKAITDIVGAYRDVRHGRFARAADRLGIAKPRRMPRKMADRWLEYQYGWRPLLGDVHGTIEQFAKSDKAGLYRVSVTKKEKSLVIEEHDSLGYGGYNMPYKIQTTKSVKVHVRLDYKPANLTLIPFVELGLTNPALLAWELIPFSFVVDWALPVGDWLSSLDAAFGYTFWGGSISTVRVSDSSIMGAVDPVSPLSYSDIRGIRSIKHMKREVYQVSPIPTLPRLKNPWSYTHAANAAALLVSAVTGAERPTHRVR
jgi:hypothetical protein